MTRDIRREILLAWMQPSLHSAQINLSTRIIKLSIVELHEIFDAKTISAKSELL